jgi:serine/threonine-protein kinase
VIGQGGAPEVPHPIHEARLLGDLSRRFDVQRLLGTGGMSIVLAAQDRFLQRRVAVKLLRCSQDAGIRSRRMLREAAVVSRLRSPHVARVLDVGWLDSRSPFIVMELLEGRDLARVVREDGPLPVSRALRCIVGACDALVEAHASGVIHRDLKPSNLFAADAGDVVPFVKVLDFGLAKQLRVEHETTKLTRGTPLMGTPRYMAPEQMAGADADERTDVWAVGVTLYELVTGRAPFDGRHTLELMENVVSRPARSLTGDLAGAPRALEVLLAWCLEKSRDDRLPSMLRLLQELNRVVAGADSETGPLRRPVHRGADECRPTTSTPAETRQDVTADAPALCRAAHERCGPSRAAVEFVAFPCEQQHRHGELDEPPDRPEQRCEHRRPLSG